MSWAIHRSVHLVLVGVRETPNNAIPPPNRSSSCFPKWGTLFLSFLTSSLWGSPKVGQRFWGPSVWHGNPFARLRAWRAASSENLTKKALQRTIKTAQAPHVASQTCLTRFGPLLKISQTTAAELCDATKLLAYTPVMASGCVTRKRYSSVLVGRTPKVSCLT